MGFTDFVSDAGLTMLNNWLVSRSYITGYVLWHQAVAEAKAELDLHRDPEAITTFRSPSFIIPKPP